jgi:predicted ATPase/DNA-binding SARP family transcriptional activator
VLTLELLGTFRATTGSDALIGFRTDKARALLAYLAVESARPQQRTSLATLLWPDMPDDIALRNLRKTLHRLYEALTPALGIDADRLLASSRQTIQLAAEMCSVDVVSFQRLLAEAAAHPHRRLHLCAACMERLTRTTSLYRGELLAGFDLPDAEPFEEWLLLKREMLLHLALQALFDLTQAHLEREEYEQAYGYAARQAELDPGREEAHRQVIRSLALSGQRAEALAYAARARQMMLDALGVEPGPETMALAKHLAAENRPDTSAPAARASQAAVIGGRRTPLQLTPFIGRQRELLQIAEYLHDPDCRLVTILGAGGMGKTRLALKVAEQAAGRSRFADGIAVVSLAGVGEPEQLPAALMSGLGLEQDPGADAREQLLDHLASRAYLLVLDNFEQLVGRTDLLVDILTAAPGVCLLVTSRLPLRLRAEQRVPLEGLDYPEFDAGQPRGRPGDVQGAASSSSVQLFVQTARRVDPTFVLSAANQRDVVRICRLVGGMPLALELAAPWVAIMDCARISATIERGVELLATDAQDVAGRHRSIEGVFAQTWQLLSPREQADLARLSVFRGPFDLNAAVEVGEASVLELASLLDRGLLHRTDGGRYQLHELLRQFAGAAAAGVPNLDLDTVRDRHAAHYLGLVAAREPALYGPDVEDAVAALQPELDNLRHAWGWAAERIQVDVLAGCLEAIARYWELSCQFEMADTLLARAIDAAQGQVRRGIPSDDAVRLLVRLLVWQAHFGEVRSHVDAAVQLLETAQVTTDELGDAQGRAIARAIMGELLTRRREFARAAADLQEACSYFAAHNEQRWLGRSLRLLGETRWRAGEYASAAEALLQARTIQESLGDRWELARIVYTLAGIAFEREDLAEARVLAEEALRLYEASGDQRHVARLKGNLGMIYANLGWYDLALQYNQAHVDNCRDLGDLYGMAIALGNRCAILIYAGREDEALEVIRRAMELAESTGHTWEAARHLGEVARLMHHRGEWDLAAAQFEQALAVLRAGDAPYYVVRPALDAAELQLDRGRLEAAAALTLEGASLAEAQSRRDELLRARILEAKIANARGERGVAGQMLHRLLAGAEDELQRADVHFALWELGQDGMHAQAALRLYRELYRRTPRHRDRERMDRLTAAEARETS